MKISRVLTLIALGGAVLSAGCFAGAYKLAGAADSGSRAVITRELPWDGARSVSLGVEADLRYVQGNGPARLIVRGPHRSVSTLSAASGQVHDALLHTGARLELTLHAPDVQEFVLNAGSRLVIENYDQPRLSIISEGRGVVEGQGKAQTVSVNLQGRSAANLARLDIAELEGRVGGAATLIAAPRETSRVTVASSASMVMLTTPPRLANTVVEKGRVFDAAR